MTMMLQGTDFERLDRVDSRRARTAGSSSIAGRALRPRQRPFIASEKARFGDPHVRVGIVAGDGGAVIWPLLIGPARAKEFLMRGHLVNGADAAKMGLVNYAVPPGEVLPKARELAQELADGPTWAIRWSVPE